MEKANVKDLASILAIWVRKCGYEENATRTDATITVSVEGITEGNANPFTEVVKPYEVKDIGEEVCREVVEIVARRFCDTVTVEGVQFKADEDGVKIEGRVHLAE